MSPVVEVSRCEICRWPIAAGGPSRCATCGWSFAEAVDQGRRVDMRATQRDWDLRAAHLAALGDDDTLRELLDEVRGGLPSEVDVIEIGQTLYRAEDSPDRARNLVAISEILGALVVGDCENVAFVCLLPDSFELYTADVNPVRTARTRGRDRRRPWTDFVPELPARPARRRFVMAGGVGCDPSSGTDPATVADAIVAGLPSLTSTSSTAVVVINGCPDWTVMTAVAAKIIERYPTAASLSHRMDLYDSVQVLIESLVRQAPVSRRHDLVLLRHEASGEVRLDPRPLFEVGDKGSDQRQLDIYAPVGPPGPVLLPVMVCDPRNEPSKWQLVEMCLLGLERGRSSRVTVELGGDAHIALSGVTAAGPAGSDRRTWPELIGQLPRRLAGSPIDVVFAVERVHTPALARGWELVRAAIEAMRAEAWSPDLIHVGVVGYGQHSGQYHGPTTEVIPLGPPDKAYRQTAAWSLLPNRSDYAAAVEDALLEAGALAWRPEARRCLVTVGGRPPHPVEKDVDPARQCPNKIDWHDGIARLTRLAVHRVSLWCDPETAPPLPSDYPLRQRQVEAWRALGEGGRLAVPDASVADLLGVIGVHFVPPSMPFAYAAVGPSPDPRRSA